VATIVLHAGVDGFAWTGLFGDPGARSMSRRSDRDAEFEALFVDQFESICQSVAFVCGDRERATDATQEAFIKAYARWGRVRRYDNPGAWVRRIAINATRDMRRSDVRRAQREQRVGTEPSIGIESVEGDTGLELLAELPERQRAIAALFYLDDLPIAEISELLDIAEGTVRFHLSHARSRLRAQLAPGDDTEPTPASEGDHVAR
jgi:RNA polymerase sigma-70 factor (ECF subfamily)